MELTEKRHIMGYRQLATILALLLLLTVVTVAVSYKHMGFWNVPVALTIASCKATLVLLFFMHLKFEGPVIRYSFIGAVFFLAIMIGFTFWDVAFR
jgi:cytochrome c oxidase subunit 4